MVATIIATILMVAIAVVGGTFTYALFNDLLGNSVIIAAAPLQVDVIVVDGYDARDSDKLRTHAGVLIDIDCPPPNARLATGDIVFIYVDNLSSHPVAIKKVVFAGTDYTFDSDATVLTKKKEQAAGGGLSWGQFAVTGGLSAETTKTNVISSGQEVTIAIRYAGDSGDMPVGKPIGVSVVTENGWAFPISIRNGMHSS